MINLLKYEHFALRIDNDKMLIILNKLIRYNLYCVYKIAHGNYPIIFLKHCGNPHVLEHDKYKFTEEEEKILQDYGIS